MTVTFELGFRQDTSRETLHCKGQKRGLWYPGRKAQGRVMEGEDDAGRLCGERSRILRLR